MEETGLLGQLGINWKLLISQAFNFFILLLVLRFFAYKPLLAVIKKRNDKIKEGLVKAEEADVRLKEVDVIAKGHLQKAEAQSVQMIKSTEEKAKVMADDLQRKAEEKHKALMQQAELAYRKQQEENKQLVMKEAADLVKKVIVKTVGLDPKAIDEALIKRAASQISNE